MKKIYIILSLLILFVLVVACSQQPDTTYQVAQNTQPIVSEGCGV